MNGETLASGGVPIPVLTPRLWGEGSSGGFGDADDGHSIHYPFSILPLPILTTTMFTRMPRMCMDGRDSHGSAFHGIRKTFGGIGRVIFGRSLRRKKEVEGDLLDHPINEGSSTDFSIGDNWDRLTLDLRI